MDEKLPYLILVPDSPLISLKSSNRHYNLCFLITKKSWKLRKVKFVLNFLISWDFPNPKNNDIRYHYYVAFAKDYPFPVPHTKKIT